MLISSSCGQSVCTSFFWSITCLYLAASAEVLPKAYLLKIGHLTLELLSLHTVLPGLVRDDETLLGIVHACFILVCYECINGTS